MGLQTMDTVTRAGEAPRTGVTEVCIGGMFPPILLLSALTLPEENCS